MWFLLSARAKNENFENVVVNSTNIKFLLDSIDYSDLSEDEVLALFKKKYGFKKITDKKFLTIIKWKYGLSSVNEIKILISKVTSVCSSLKYSKDFNYVISDFRLFVSLVYGIAKKLTLNESEIKIIGIVCDKLKNE